MDHKNINHKKMNRLLAEEIKRVRKSKGVKSTFMASQLGLSDQHYSTLESGRINVRALHLIVIENNLGVEIYNKIKKTFDKLKTIG